MLSEIFSSMGIVFAGVSLLIALGGGGIWYCTRSIPAKTLGIILLVIGTFGLLGSGAACIYLRNATPPFPLGNLDKALQDMHK